MTGFSSAFDIDTHYLWVPRPEKDDSLLTQASYVFMPFSNGLWLMLAGCVIFMCAARGVYAGWHTARRR